MMDVYRLTYSRSNAPRTSERVVEFYPTKGEAIGAYNETVRKPNTQKAQLVLMTPKPDRVNNWKQLAFDLLSKRTAEQLLDSVEVVIEWKGDPDD